MRNGVTNSVCFILCYSLSLSRSISCLKNQPYLSAEWDIPLASSWFDFIPSLLPCSLRIVYNANWLCWERKEREDRSLSWQFVKQIQKGHERWWPAAEADAHDWTKTTQAWGLSWFRNLSLPHLLTLCKQVMPHLMENGVWFRIEPLYFLKMSNYFTMVKKDTFKWDLYSWSRLGMLLNELVLAPLSNWDSDSAAAAFPLLSSTAFIQSFH